jgi:hypothetical protein
LQHNADFSYRAKSNICAIAGNKHHGRIANGGLPAATPGQRRRILWRDRFAPAGAANLLSSCHHGVAVLMPGFANRTFPA